MQNFFHNNTFFVSVFTLCDIFYSRFKRFFGLNVFYIIDFSLNIKLRAFLAAYVFFY